MLLLCIHFNVIHLGTHGWAGGTGHRATVSLAVRIDGRAATALVRPRRRHHRRCPAAAAAAAAPAAAVAAVVAAAATTAASRC